MQRDTVEDLGKETDEEPLYEPRASPPPSSITVALARRQERPGVVVHVEPGRPETLRFDLPWFQRQILKQTGTWNRHLQRAAMQRLRLLVDLNHQRQTEGQRNLAATYVFTIQWRVVVGVGFYRLADCAWKIGEASQAKAYADELYRIFDTLRGVMPWTRPDRWPAAYKWVFVGVVPNLHLMTLYLRDIFVKLRSEAEPGVDVPPALRRPARLYAIRAAARPWRPGDPVWGSQQWEWTAKVFLNAERTAVWVGVPPSRLAREVSAWAEGDASVSPGGQIWLPNGIGAPAFLRSTVQVGETIASWRALRRQTLQDRSYFVSLTPNY